MRPPAARARRLVWLAPLAAFAAVAGVTAVVAVALLAGGDAEQPGDATVAGPKRGRARRGPRRTQGGRLGAGNGCPAGTPLRTRGPLRRRRLARRHRARPRPSVRSRTPVTGWAPASAVAARRRPLRRSRSSTRTGSGGRRWPVRRRPSRPTPARRSRRSLPDLLVDDVYARDNRLVIVVSNVGSADIDGPIEVSVDGGPAHRIDVGKPLRPGDTLEQALEGEYVQRRAQVSVTLRAAAIQEENAGNNVFTGVVEPDAPNDLEILDVAVGVDGDHIVVTTPQQQPDSRSPDG